MYIKYCSKCLLPETKPDLSFDDDGVCSACVAAVEKNVGLQGLVDLEKIHGFDLVKYDD
jgi:hypothetical protein